MTYASATFLEIEARQVADGIGLQVLLDGILFYIWYMGLFLILVRALTAGHDLKLLTLCNWYHSFSWSANSGEYCV